jgi:hypothetical protein
MSAFRSKATRRAPVFGPDSLTTSVDANSGDDSGDDASTVGRHNSRNQPEDKYRSPVCRSYHRTRAHWGRSSEGFARMRQRSRSTIPLMSKQASSFPISDLDLFGEPGSRSCVPNAFGIARQSHDFGSSVEKGPCSLGLEVKRIF